MLKTIEFIRETYKTKREIPLHAPLFEGNELNYVTDAINSTFVSSVGRYVNLFEDSILKFTKTKSAVAVMNGTAALSVGLRVVGVRPGDEVITQSLTFVATGNAILYNQASPVFLDVDYETMGLSSRAVLNFLKEFGERREDGSYNRLSGRRIAACVPMHTFGFPTDIIQLSNVCSEWKIPIVEDAAESLGSTVNGIHTGTFGKCGVFSFNGNKIITGGSGGVLISDDVQIGKLAKHLTTTAKVDHPYEYYHDQLGFNYRLPNLNAALLCAQMEQLERFLLEKRNRAKAYSDFFQNNSAFKFREEQPNTQANYWLNCIEANNLEERNLFIEFALKNGISVRPIWNLLWKLPHFQGCFRDNQENSIFLEERIINIPSSV